jgi:hypothetical protein
VRERLEIPQVRSLQLLRGRQHFPEIISKLTINLELCYDKLDKIL